MERTLTTTSSLPAPVQDLPDAAPARLEWRAALGRLLPLWRHAVAAGALFVLLAGWVQVRVEVQQLRKDLDSSGRAQREARVLNDRLRLEVDSRRRALAMEKVAAQLAIGDQARVVHLPVGD